MGVQLGDLVPGTVLTGRLQPVVRFQRQDKQNKAFEVNTVNLGLNFLLKGHAINFKADYAINDRRVSGEDVDTFRFQTQLVF